MTEIRGIWGKAFLIFFAYSLAMGLLIQLVLLPYVFPSLHSGDGLMKAHDWVTYHQLAIEMVSQIRNEGWGKWQSHLNGWVEPGLAAFVYYFTVSKPYVLMPFNALIHALTGILIAKILFLFFKDKKAVLIGACPFIFFPSSLEWVSQIHKDGIAFLGSAFFIWGWTSLLSQSLPIKKQIFSCLGIWVGFWLISVTRSYLCLLFFLFSIVFFLVFLIQSGFNLKRGGRIKLISVRALMLFLTVSSLKIILRSTSDYSTPIPVQASQVSEVSQENELKTSNKEWFSEKKLSDQTSTTTEIILNQGPSQTLNQSLPQSLLSQPQKVTQRKKIQVVSPPPAKVEWIETSWLPKSIDQKLYNLSRVRSGFIYTQIGQSNFDKKIFFYSAYDVIRYVPRAFQVVLFGPFPKDWFAKASSESSSALRKVVGAEMIFIYFIFPFILLAISSLYKRASFAALFVFIIGFLWLYGTTAPNYGTLHRFRYFYLMLLAGVGLTQSIFVLKNVRGLNRNISQAFQRISVGISSESSLESSHT